MSHNFFSLSMTLPSNKLVRLHVSGLYNESTLSRVKQVAGSGGGLHSSRPRPQIANNRLGLKVLRGKHSSLFDSTVGDKKERFLTLTTGACAIQLFRAVNNSKL